MIREGMTIREAAEMWVREFNAIPQGVIDKLMKNGEEVTEITPPSFGDRAYIFNGEHRNEYGEVQRQADDDSDSYIIELDGGEEVEVEVSDFEVERDGTLPMWGTMWTFGDSCDDHWLEDEENRQIMADCGFRIYEQEDFGYIFGIDGAGYSFYEQHWIPLYRRRGLQWHDPKAEEEHQMKEKGYHKGRLGAKEYWMDANDNAIKEVAR